MRLFLIALLLLAAARTSADITVKQKRRATCGAPGVFCVRGDLDGDGSAGDLAVIYIDEDGYLHIRSSVGGQDGNGVIHIGQAWESRRDGRLHGAKLLESTVAGIPLVAVDADTGRCCRSYTKFLSFQPRDIRLALDVLDYDETSDEVYTRDVHFDMPTRTVRVVEHHSNRDQHGRESRSPDHVKRYKLEGRIYRPTD